MNAGGRSEQTLAAAMDQPRAGRLANAERLYRLVCDTDPKNARAFHLLGVVAHQLNRPDAALLVGRAVTLDPDFAEAHNDRGVILAANGLFADALPCFQKAVALKSGYHEARNNLGRGLRSLGRLDEATRQFELVLKSTPDSPLAHFNLASMLELTGERAAAEKHYRNAVSLRPDFVDAHLHLAALLQDTDRLPEALAHAERAVALRPDSAGARNNLGNILRTMGRRDEFEAAVLSSFPGPQRSRTSSLVRLPGLQNHGREIHHAGFAGSSRPERADQARYRQRIFQAAFELEGPDQRVAQRAQPRSVSCLRLLHEQ